MTRKVLITSALPYVNNVPHLGNLIGATLSADVYARYCRSRGYEVAYVCGTDDHGTATETKALQEKVTPKQLCDKYAALHKQIYDWFNISFDVFGRTSDARHVPVTQHLYNKLNEHGLILEKDSEQLYSEADKMFLADRYVLGTCPKCNFKDARGDQCDACGALLSPTELINPRSALSGATPIMRTTRHLYLDLAALQPRLTQWLEDKQFSDNTMRTTKAWLERGLEPRAITRDLKWGVPVPRAGFEHKVFYVWFDAPIGYISMTGGLKTSDGKTGQAAIDYWWRDSKTQLYQFIGKDNIPFHSVIFPSVLLGSEEDWVTVSHINTTEFLNYEGTKFSKSRGIGLFGDNAMALEFSADAWRYYLLTNRPEQADTNFSWTDFQGKLNGELVANLGNLVNRTISFINQFFDGVIPASAVRDVDTAFLADAHNQIEKITHELEGVKLKDALHSVMRLSMLGNAFFQKHEPWKTRSENPSDCAATISTLANFLLDLAVVLEPFLPGTANAIAAQLGTTLPKWQSLTSADVAGSDVVGSGNGARSSLKAGHHVAKNEILFAKVEDARITELKARFGGAQEVTAVAKPALKSHAVPASKNAAPPVVISAADAWSAIELVVGKITSVERHPNADKLFVERVDLGSRGERTIVSGLAAHYETGGLLGKTIVIVANLAPAKLRGVVSEGMLLAAENSEGIVGVVETDAAPGTLVTFAGEPHGMPDGAAVTYDTFSAITLTQREDGLYCDENKVHAGTHGLRADKNVIGRVR